MSCRTSRTNSPGAKQTQNYRKQGRKAQTTSCPPHFHKAPFSVCLVSSPKPPTMQTSLPFQATYSTALSAITIRKFCPNAKLKSLFLQLKAIISFPHHSRQEKKCIPVFLTVTFCVFRDHCHVCLQSPLLSVKPSSFALSSPIVFSTLSVI